ncbi:bestrophin family ion channel [Paraburkholderia sp. IMGN_8]|uniref:bestrophin family protein n=1 Tax=Paraburkholderia sp. IMGN_8 TaxID=3136564 RepID=UPI0031012CD9
MIVRPRLHWLRMLFVWRGSVLPQIAPRLALTSVFSALVVAFHGRLFVWKVPMNFVPFTLIGLTLAIFLGFRNSTSYARFWEARTLWGILLNDTRSATRQAITLMLNQSTTHVFVYRLIATVHALRHQLRGTDTGPDLARLLSREECIRLNDVIYKPTILLQMASEWIGEQLRDGNVSPAVVQATEVSMGKISDAIGGCERIAATPIPFTYSVIIHRTIFLYCLLLPFGLVDSIGLMTPIIATFISYTFFALEELGAELEDPFGLEPNDLPLTALCMGIEATLREALGEGNIACPISNGYIQT